jgi:alkanesulfonate monooxygenase SsuD/methylene tetrahydromethanopterin reductase-like flavin-dependent oxidoreductase (luciferase family)
MEFGVLFTSHPNHVTEPYPHRAVHARVTAEIQAADRLGYDTAWVAEHHFSNQYGIMPDVFTYMGYLAAQTSRIRLGTAVVTVPLYDPIRVVENMAFVDILSGGRVILGLGSGYRPYEFEGFGRDFDRRRDVQEEAIDLILELLHKRRTRHEGAHFHSVIEGDYEIFPVSQQEPHPPLFMAGATDRSLGYAARHGFGLMLSTLPSPETLAKQIGLYRSHLKDAPAPLDRNPGFGKVDIARWVYVADTDAAAKRDTEQGIVRHISHFMGAGTAGYLGNVSEKNRAEGLSYDELAATTLLHGSPATVIAKLRELQHKTGLTSLLLHYPPYYGHDNAMRSLRLFAEKVMPEFRPPASRKAVA